MFGVVELLPTEFPVTIFWSAVLRAEASFAVGTILTIFTTVGVPPAEPVEAVVDGTSKGARSCCFLALLRLGVRGPPPLPLPAEGE